MQASNKLCASGIQLRHASQFPDTKDKVPRRRKMMIAASISRATKRS